MTRPYRAEELLDAAIVCGRPGRGARRLKRTVVTLLIAALSAIAGDRTPKAAATAMELAGHYYRGDGLGYNVTVNLEASGDYNASWQGCLGEYGTAKGIWSVSGELITFKPSNETGLMKGHLRELEIVHKDTAFVLVPKASIEVFTSSLGNLKDHDNSRADRFFAFHRQPPNAAK